MSGSGNHWRNANTANTGTANTGMADMNNADMDNADMNNADMDNADMDEDDMTNMTNPDMNEDDTNTTDTNTADQAMISAPGLDSTRNRVVRWRLENPVCEIALGSTLVIEAENPFTLRVGVNGWDAVEDIVSESVRPGVDHVTLQATRPFRSFDFVRRWDDGTWEARSHRVEIRAAGRAATDNDWRPPRTPRQPSHRNLHVVTSTGRATQGPWDAA